ncbi:MAG: hypothetical protein R2795_11120 [Saprospiraceae bacterium]
MKSTILLLLVSMVYWVQAQDCQVVSLTLDIPAGVTKHHFPSQPMPVASGNQYFTYLADWNQGDVAVRVRFSNDGVAWTEWAVLKKDFARPDASNSNLHISNGNYEFVEWSVYNKAGTPTSLDINFYYPSDAPVMAASGAYPMTIGRTGCPQPDMLDMGSKPSVVSSNEER